MKKINILILLFIVFFINCGHDSGIYSNHSQVVKNSVNQKSIKQEQKQDSIQDEIIHFTGTVKMIETINSKNLSNIQTKIDIDGNSNFEKGVTFIPVNNDPRWLLVVHIESIQREKVPFNSETNQIFGIHSPTKLFLTSAENVIGRTFEFELNWSINEKNQSTFKNLKADNKSPVYIFDIKNSRDAKNFQEIFNRITLLENPESFDSSISFVDFIFLDNNSLPWLVLFHEACDGWYFELLEPNSNGQGFTTRLSGAEGSYI